MKLASDASLSWLLQEKRLSFLFPGAGKRGPTPLLQKQIELLTQLPKTQQKVMMQMLDGVLSQINR